MTSSTIHLKWMKEALSVAKTALNLKEVPVGCIIVYNENIIGKGHNLTNIKKNATRHAEFEAIDEALNWCMNNNIKHENVFPHCSLYVTCEPCIMCASALKQINLKKWIYGCKNERFGGCGSVLNLMCNDNNNNFEIVSGIYEDLAINMLKEFYTNENPFAPEPKSKTNRKLNIQSTDA